MIDSLSERLKEKGIDIDKIKKDFEGVLEFYGWPLPLKGRSCEILFSSIPDIFPYHWVYGERSEMSQEQTEIFRRLRESEGEENFDSILNHSGILKDFVSSAQQYVR